MREIRFAMATNTHPSLYNMHVVNLVFVQKLVNFFVIMEDKLMMWTSYKCHFIWSNLHTLLSFINFFFLEHTHHHQEFATLVKSCLMATI